MTEPTPMLTPEGQPAASPDLEPLPEAVTQQRTRGWSALSPRGRRQRLDRLAELAAVHADEKGRSLNPGASTMQTMPSRRTGEPDSAEAFGASIRSATASPMYSSVRPMTPSARPSRPGRRT
jgi:hypothetical protein